MSSIGPVHEFRIEPADQADVAGGPWQQTRISGVPGVYGGPWQQIRVVPLASNAGGPWQQVQNIVAGIEATGENTVAFGQTLGISLELEINPENTILFDCSAGTEQEHFAENVLTFLHAALTNISVFTVESVVTFLGEAVPGLELERELVSNIIFEQLAKLGILESAGNAIALTSAVARGEDPNNVILFTGDVDEESGPTTTSPLIFSQDVTVQKILNISVEHTVVFDHEAIASNFQLCDDQRYTPVGLPTITFGDNDDVTLACSGDSVILRNPELGNSEELDVVRSFQRSRSGSHSAYKDSIWPDSMLITISFVPITRAKALEVLDFINNCLGRLITYTDQDDRQWSCILVNTQTAVQPLSNDDCYFRVNLELDANPI